jgi:hypothetical protein
MHAMRWTRTALAALAIAIVFVTVLWFSAGALKRYLDDAFGTLFTPAVVVAIALSSHPDNINPLIYFLALVVQAFAMAFLLLATFHLLASLRRRNRA